MAAYLKGDRQAFDKLFRLLAPQVYGFFMRRFGNTAIADDMLQTTFLKLHRARKDYRIGAPLRPWLFTIAARVRLDELRRRDRRPEILDSDAVERAADEDGARRYPTSEPVERAQLAASVRRALATLPDSQRTVIVLHRYEGMTFAQIAEVLGSTEGAIKLRAFRGYERLRKELAPVLSDGEPR